MIVLNKNIIRKLDRIRMAGKAGVRIRAIFVLIISIAIWYTMKNDIFERYNFTILALLLSTFIINLISDMLKSETENILDAIEYDKAKIKYNSADTKF